MLRTAAAIAVFVSAAVVAAPVPKPSEKEVFEKVWGKSDGEGEFEPNGKELTIRTTFGKPNHSFSWGERVTAPRTAQTVRGDFELTVRVLEATPPNKDAKFDNGQPETVAGLYIRGDKMSLKYALGQTYPRFNGADGKLQRWHRIEANYPNGGASGSVGRPEDGKSAWLRLIRKDNKITMSCSSDGEKWSTPNNPFANIDMSIPDELTVGVFLSHSTYQFAHATFDNFTVAKPKTEKPQQPK